MYHIKYVKIHDAMRLFLGEGFGWAASKDRAGNIQVDALSFKQSTTSLITMNSDFVGKLAELIATPFPPRYETTIVTSMPVKSVTPYDTYGYEMDVLEQSNSVKRVK